MLMKKLFFIILLSFLTQSVFCEQDPASRLLIREYFIENPQRALELYAGNWSGSEQLRIGKDVLMEAMVDERGVISESSGVPRLIIRGRITKKDGETYKTRSVMYVKNNKLMLEIYALSGEVNYYVGTLDFNKVKWLPRDLVLNYDYQIDTFYRTDKGYMLHSVSDRYVEEPSSNFKGILTVEMYLKKDAPMYHKSKMNRSQMGIFGR